MLITTGLFAQSPDKMSYQAVIRDASSALITSTTVGMQISILQGSVTGTPVYVETHTPASNLNGLVTLEIGSGTVVSGTFATIDWSNGPYFLQTETDLAGGTNYTITGTSQLMSVPYALHSKTAGSISGGITETDPVYAASIAAGITATDTANWNNHTVDTQLDSAGIAAHGYVAGPHTVDTQLDSAGIAAHGYVAGPHTVDTQIDSTGIAALGFIAGSAHDPGDLKHSLLAVDHNGWYLLDGRAVSSLPTNAQLVAGLIGFGTALPDMTGRFLKNTDGVEMPGTLGGADSVALSQANIPAYSLPVATSNSSGTHNHTASSNTTGAHTHDVSGTTSSNGAHTHSYNDYYWHDSGNVAAYGTPGGDDVGQRLQAARTTGSAGNHTHTFSDTSTSNGNHSHTITVNNAGGHTHDVTVQSGGSGTEVEIIPSHMVTHTFIYLGN